MSVLAFFFNLFIYLFSNAGPEWRGFGPLTIHARQTRRVGSELMIVEMSMQVPCFRGTYVVFGLSVTVAYISSWCCTVSQDSSEVWECLWELRVKSLDFCHNKMCRAPATPSSIDSIV